MCFVFTCGKSVSLPSGLCCVAIVLWSGLGNHPLALCGCGSERDLIAIDSNRKQHPMASGVQYVGQGMAALGGKCIVMLLRGHIKGLFSWVTALLCDNNLLCRLGPPAHTHLGYTINYECRRVREGSKHNRREHGELIKDTLVDLLLFC